MIATHVSERLPREVAATIAGPGARLEHRTAAELGARLGHDFGSVRVHTGQRAARSASSLGARGYAVGENVVLGNGSPALLAHELAHVAQQRQGGSAGEAEPRARAAAAKVTAGHSVGAAELGGAPVGLHLDGPDDEPRPVLPPLPQLSLSWDDVWRRPPRGTPPLTLGVPPLTLPSTPSLVPPPGTLQAPTVTSTLAPTSGLPPGFFLPPPSAPAASAPTSAPSRLGLKQFGPLSLGLRLGFPEAEDLPNLGSSAAALALQRATVINQTLTGNIPTGFAAVDKSKLIGFAWWASPPTSHPTSRAG